MRYTCTSATAAILHRVGAVVSSLGNLRSDLSLQVLPSSRPVPLPPTTAANEFRSSPRRHVSNPNLNQPNLGVTSSSPRSLHSLSRAPCARVRQYCRTPNFPYPTPNIPPPPAPPPLRRVSTSSHVRGSPRWGWLREGKHVVPREEVEGEDRDTAPQRCLAFLPLRSRSHPQ